MSVAKAFQAAGLSRGDEAVNREEGRWWNNLVNRGMLVDAKRVAEGLRRRVFNLYSRAALRQRYGAAVSALFREVAASQVDELGVYGSQTDVTTIADRHLTT